MTVEGRFVDSSNATLLVTCRLDGVEVAAVYKPVRGERPLWDFPEGLHLREVAAFELDRTLGWGLVPVTVLREVAPFGPGSVQRLVDCDDVSHYFTLRDEERWQAALRRIAAFDVVANNADRKSGHVLLAGDALWGIDHGLTFHEEPKLRTVIWDFAGDPLDEDTAQDLRRLVRDGVPEPLGALLSPREARALRDRAGRLVAAGRYPEPPDRHPYPWPLV
jgi:uncharacterized repeat protein (TIGR03843 family)